MSVQTKPSIVFAHGLWADGSCFNKIIPALQAEGHEVVSAQNSLDTLKGDVVAVIRALGRVSSPAILVGHSYGGTVITAAGTDDRVAGLVYIAALAPDEDETSQSQQDKFPRTDIFAHIEVADGRVWMRPDGVQYFREISPSRSRRSSGQPKVCRPSICSTRRWKARPGGRSRPGTSWARTTTPFIPSCSASSRSGWAPASMRPTAATCPCSRSPPS